MLVVLSGEFPKGFNFPRPSPVMPRNIWPLTTLLLTLLTFPFALAGSGVLYTDSVTYCAEPKAVNVDEFDIAYHQSNGSVIFSFSIAALEPNLNVSINIYLNAYGFDIVNDTVDLCSYFEGVICPLPQANFTGKCDTFQVIPLMRSRLWYISSPLQILLEDPRYCIHRPEPRGIRSN